MANKMGLDALKEAASLIAAHLKPAAGEASAEKSDRKVAGFVPIIEPQPPITEIKTLGKEVNTIGKAVAQAIDEDPVASKLPYKAKKELVSLVFEQLKYC